MAYDVSLARRVRTYLGQFPDLQLEEKKMFGGLAFIINQKMCINVSGENLMCRFDPKQTEELAKTEGFQPMVMKGRVYEGYAYIGPGGVRTELQLAQWIERCLAFNRTVASAEK